MFEELAEPIGQHGRQGRSFSELGVEVVQEPPGPVEVLEASGADDDFAGAGHGADNNGGALLCLLFVYGEV